MRKYSLYCVVLKMSVNKRSSQRKGFGNKRHCFWMQEVTRMVEQRFAQNRLFSKLLSPVLVPPLQPLYSAEVAVLMIIHIILTSFSTLTNTNTLLISGLTAGLGRSLQDRKTTRAVEGFRQPANKNILSEDAAQEAWDPHSSEPESRPSRFFLQRFTPHIWWTCDNQCQTILEIRYPGYQEVDLPSTSLRKHTLIFKLGFHKRSVVFEM